MISASNRVLKDRYHIDLAKLERKEDELSLGE